MGAAGRLARVRNEWFTPATHAALPAAAAPGQLSVRELRSLRGTLG